MQLSIIQKTNTNYSQQLQPQFPKVPCAFHPTQFITNFCACQCCLLPLCPSCIKIHTNQHSNILKAISPQYQPITELFQDIYQEVEELLQTNEQNYNKINEVDAKIWLFRDTIVQKIVSLKNNVIGQVQKYFGILEEKVCSDIANMSYVRTINQYKEQTKRSTIGLKNISKSLNIDNNKIMRTVIKYKGGQIKKEVQQFQKTAQQFLSQINHNFISFSVRDDYKQMIDSSLENIQRIEFSDINSPQPVPEIFHKIKQVYDRDNSKQSKKQIIKSLGTLLQNSSSKNPSRQGTNPKNTMKNSRHNKSHQILTDETSEINTVNNADPRNYLTCNIASQDQSNKQRLESYNSVSNEIRNMQNQQNNHLVTPNSRIHQETPQKDNSRRRSLSRGKGLSLMQLNTMFIANNINVICPNGNNKIRKSTNCGGPRAVDIKQPYEFNRTTIIRKSDFQY